MQVVIVGCGRLGAELACRLHRQEHRVCVVDQVAAAFDKLHPDYGGRTVQGEVLSRDVLHRAGIEKAEGLAAVTNVDAVNVVVAHLAREVYRVPNVVARNYDPKYAPLHEAFGVRAVSSTRWGADRIEELLRGPEAPGGFVVGGGEVRIYEVRVADGWKDRCLEDLVPTAGCRVVALTRGGRGALPEGGERLRPGDLLHVSATPAGIAALRDRLADRRGGGG